MGRNSLTVHPFVQEHPYGLRKIVDGKEYVYMPDPWTFPEGYGNVWCSLEQLEKDKIEYPKGKHYI